MRQRAIQPRHEGTARGRPGGDLLLEDHRVEITRHCRRMLGSAVDADDAAQETLLRAWQGLDRFENRSSLRTWLYRIATNVCLDVDRRRRLRPVPIDVSEPAIPPALLSVDDDPGEHAVSRESVRLALVAAHVHLPHRQRAVLLLRDVLCWRAAEVAELLGVSVFAVNSTLQRARASVAARVHASNARERREDDGDELVTRYLDAFERHDLGALIERIYRDACDRSRRDGRRGVVPRR